MNNKLNSIPSASTNDDISNKVDGNIRLPNLSQNHLLAAVQSMSVVGKNKLMAIWLTKERHDNFKTLDTLFYLDDKWNEVYQEFRIKEGFAAAQLKAYNYVLSLVYGS